MELGVQGLQLRRFQRSRGDSRGFKGCWGIQGNLSGESEEGGGGTKGDARRGVRYSMGVWGIQ